LNGFPSRDYFKVTSRVHYGSIFFNLSKILEGFKFQVFKRNKLNRGIKNWRYIRYPSRAVKSKEKGFPGIQEQ